MEGYSTIREALITQPGTEMPRNIDEPLEMFNVLEEKAKSLKTNTQVLPIDQVTTMGLTSDNKFLVTGLYLNAINSKERSELNVWNIQTEENIFPQRKNWIVYLAIFPKSNKFIVGYSDDKIELFEIIENNCKPIHGYNNHSDHITCISISPNESYYASGSKDKTVVINYRAIQLIDTPLIIKRDNIISCLGFSSSSDHLVICTEKMNELVIIKLSDRSERRVKSNNESIKCLAFDNNTTYFYTGENSIVKKWDILKAELIKDTEIKHQSTVICLAVTSDYIISGSNDKYIIVWDKTKKIQHLKYLNLHPLKSFIIEQNFLIIHTANSKINVLDIINKRIEFSLQECQKTISCMSVSKDLSSIITGYLDNNIQISSIAKVQHFLGIIQAQETPNLGDNNDIFSAKFSNFGSQRTNINDWKTLLHEINEYLERKEAGKQITETYGKYIYSEDNTIAVILLSNEVIIWNKAQKKIDHSFTGSFSAIKHTAISNNKKYIILVSDQKKIIVMHVNSIKTPFEFEEKVHNILGFAVSNNDKYIITLNQANSPTIWNIKEKRKELDLGKLSHNITIENVENITRNFEENSFISFGINSNLRLHGFFNRLERKAFPFEGDVKIILTRKLFNLNHYYCYYDYHKHLRKALQLGCEIRVDSSNNSPLYYALSRSSQRCIKVLLKYMIWLSNQTNDSYKHTFLSYAYALRRDILDLFKISCTVLPQFLESIFIVVEANGNRGYYPNKNSLPIIKLSSTQQICSKSFGIVNNDFTGKGAAIHFRETPYRFHLTLGSKKSMKMLLSILNSKNKKIYGTGLIKTIISYKWSLLKAFVYSFALFQWINLFNMILLVTYYSDILWLNITFISFNGLLLGYEILQLKSIGISNYISIENVLDILRGMSCLIWTVLNLSSVSKQLITFIMVLLNFGKGIEAFRAFDDTRYYIRLILSSFDDVKAFFWIFIYSIFAFGILYFISSPDSINSDFALFWIIPYQYNSGNFDDEKVFSYQYSCYIIASLVNSVLILNLLISILGDSFDKFKLEANEIDFSERIQFIMDIESLFFWKKKSKDKHYIHVCEENSGQEINKWNGKNKLILNKLNDLTEKIKTAKKKNKSERMKINKRIDQLEQTLGNKIDKLEQILEKKLDIIINK